MENRLHLVDCSIVVAAANHNPTILNPDFLFRNNIVNSDWKVVKTLTTEVISQVLFENGKTIIVDPKRIIFRDQELNIIEKPTLDEIATNYVDLLKHVTYTAVGININFAFQFSSIDEAEQYILDNLIVSGNWKSANGGAKTATVKFSYKENETIINISLSTAEVTLRTAPTPFPAILAAANYHRDLPKEYDKALREMKEIIGKWREDTNSFEHTLNLLLI
jgi:hypothetical protein